jgi:Fe2+ or Zn2+ uptake regulation protein
LVWALGQRTRLGQGNDPVYVKTRCFAPFPFPDTTDEQKSVVRNLAEEIDAHRKRVQGDHPDLTLTAIYNVLEKLRNGVTEKDLGADDHKVYQDGLVLLLLELHDRLDRTVIAAYGWPASLTDDHIVERLLSLNAARAVEERTGVIQWLRPEYQVPRFASIAERAQFELAGAAPGQEGTEAVSKPMYPSDDVAQTAAVMTVLGSASGSMDAEDIAATFRQGRRVLARINAVLTALARMGYVSAVDGGGSYVLRHAA